MPAFLGDLSPPAGRDTVLVVAAEPLRGALAELARSRRFEVRACATPLDVCQSLACAAARTAFAIISCDRPWARALRELLDEDYPEIKSIMLIS